MANLGNRRNDRRPPRMPKDPEKRAKEMKIREYAANAGISIGVARAMFRMAEEDAQCESQQDETKKEALSCENTDT